MKNSLSYPRRNFIKSGTAVVAGGMFAPLLLNSCKSENKTTSDAAEKVIELKASTTESKGHLPPDVW